MSMLNIGGIACVVAAALDAYDSANGLAPTPRDDRGTEVLVTSIQWVLDHPSQDEFALLHAWGVTDLEPAPHVACRAGIIRALALELVGGSLS